MKNTGTLRPYELLLRIGSEIADSKHSNETLQKVADLIVPSFADFYTLEAVKEKGTLELEIMRYKDSQEPLIAIYRQTKKTQSVATIPTSPKLYSSITDVLSKESSEAEQEVINKLQINAMISVPIRASTKVLGVLTFALVRGSHRNYRKEDLAIATDIANRLGQILENENLYTKREQQNDKFFSIASHELKTPITTIKAFTQLLSKYYASDKTSQASIYLAKVDVQLNRLTKLIQDLLDVSRIQAGDLLYNHEVFDLNEVMKETIGELQITTQKYTIHYKGKPFQYVQGDKNRISQVLSNLLVNAIQYSPQANSIEVTLTPRKSDFLISIKDHGVGIPQDQLDKIFSRFYRIYDKTRASVPGLGIGLYISSEIIKRHNGELWVESDEGKGATFSFSLPKHGIL